MPEKFPDLPDQRAIGDCQQCGDDVPADSPEGMVTEKRFDFQVHVVGRIRFRREEVVPGFGNGMAPVVGEEGFEEPEFEEDESGEEKDEGKALHWDSLAGAGRGKVAAFSVQGV